MEGSHIVLFVHGEIHKGLGQLSFVSILVKKVKKEPELSHFYLNQFKKKGFKIIQDFECNL